MAEIEALPASEIDGWREYFGKLERARPDARQTIGGRYGF